MPDYYVEAETDSGTVRKEYDHGPGIQSLADAIDAFRYDAETPDVSRTEVDAGHIEVNPIGA